MGLILGNAVPMRWPSGPLEIARREKSEGFGARARQALERWHEPSALDVLQDTPIDCLVVTWAAGLPADAEQWSTAAPLVEAARRRNLAVVGWVDGAGDHRQALAAAKTAGLAAVAIRGFRGGADIPVIAWSEREDVPWDSAGPSSGHCRQRLARCKYEPGRRRRQMPAPPASPGSIPTDGTSSWLARGCARRSGLLSIRPARARFFPPRAMQTRSRIPKWPAGAG